MIKFKYPRTYHLPWSEGAKNDDRILDSTDQFIDKQVVVTEKLDGESATLSSEYIHARSLDSGSHPCRTKIRGLWGKIRHEIPDGWRICGENMEAAHSIWYLNLDKQEGMHSLFYCFGIYDENNKALSWSETKSYCEMLGLFTPPVIYEGLWNEKKIKDSWKGESSFLTFDVPENHRMPNDFNNLNPTSGEGYVVRVIDAFPYGEFYKNTGKWVRKSHIQTDEHWMSKPVLPNLTVNEFSHSTGS